jgi:outer membrane protein W
MHIMVKPVWRKGAARALVLTAAALTLAPTAARAQIVRVPHGEARQAIGFQLGYFALKGEDSRVAGDVLLEDLPSLAFNIKDFNGATVGGEWLFNAGEFLEAGVGVGFYQRTTPSVYREFQNTNGSEIEQDLKLRVVPMTASIRFLPIGRDHVVEPYVGVGIGVFNWRYSETGEFVDFTDNSIFRARYVAKGNTAGPVFLGGLRAPVGDVFAVGLELKYQKADADIDRAETGLLGDKIDLGGWNTSFTMHFRF